MSFVLNSTAWQAKLSNPVPPALKLAFLEVFALELTERFRKIASLLVDQQRARVIVPPQQASLGHWFGGGNMIQDEQGTIWLVGRYRNQGDSRTGLGAGQRGLELAIFRSSDRGMTFEKCLSWKKSDLNVGSHEVLSIEGSALRATERGVELFVSTEKTGIGYPAGLESYLKPGTGVWTIDRVAADSIEELEPSTVETVLKSDDPRHLHVKDPFLGSHRGRPCLMFCTHPFCWTSSNTGFVPLDGGAIDFSQSNVDFFRRGFTWDVAITRATAVMPLPPVGVIADRDVKLLFYDGGESVRNLDEHPAAIKRPRGYSCEELGGVAYFEKDDLQTVQRLSVIAPMFVSPHGTGCSRYVDVLSTEDKYIATWQQAQPDGSQALVTHAVDREQVEALLR